MLFRAGEGPEARAAIAQRGEIRESRCPGELVQAEVPSRRLVDLEADSAVRYVRPPIDYSEPADAEKVELEVLSPGQAGAYAGEQIQKTNAAAWHAAGITGQNVKVGILERLLRRPLQRGGRRRRDPCGIGDLLHGGWAPIARPRYLRSLRDSKHGIGVAEAVIDMAPSAQIYFATR